MRLGYLLAICLLCVQEGFALRKPDVVNVPKDKALLSDINREMTDAQNISAGIGAYQVLLQKETNRVDGSKVKIAQYRKLIADGEERRNFHFTKVIRLMVQLYDLNPDHPSGTIMVPGSNFGKAAVWTVLARKIQPRWIVGENGIAVKHDIPKVPPGKRVEGVTFNDGISFIDPVVFSRSLGYLAATIYHESIHFEQNLDPKKAKLSTDEQCSAAFMAAYYAKDDFGLTENEAQHFLDMARAKNPGGNAVDSASPQIGDDAYYSAHDEKELQAIKDGAAEVERSIDEDRTRRETRATEERQRQEQARLEREQRESVGNWWRQLVDEAAKCGFRPTNLSEGMFSFEGNNTMKIRMHGDINVMKARFVVARACMNTTFRDREACNDALGLLGREWSNQAFRYGISSPEPSVVNNCLVYVAKKLKKPTDIRSLTDVADKFWKEWTDAESDARRSREANQLQPAPYESQPREKPNYKDCLAGNCVDLPSRISVPGLSY